MKSKELDDIEGRAADWIAERDRQRRRVGEPNFWRGPQGRD